MPTLSSPGDDPDNLIMFHGSLLSDDEWAQAFRRATLLIKPIKVTGFRLCGNLRNRFLILYATSTRRLMRLFSLDCGKVVQ